MAYATIDDLRIAFGEREVAQLTQRNRDYVEATDEAVAAKFLADASVEIDSRVAVRYAIPVSPVPPLLRIIACDIARFRMYDDGPPDSVRERYDDAIKLLDNIAAGRAVLVTATGTLPGAPAEPIVTPRAAVGVPFDADYGAEFRLRYGRARLGDPWPYGRTRLGEPWSW